MKIYLLRHGEAVDGTEARCKDSDRPLAAKGIQRTRQLAHTLGHLEISFDLILSSPLTRARETAEIIARSLKLEGHLIFSEHLTPSGDLQRLIDQILIVRPPAENVLLVGHEPQLGNLISHLCVGGPGLAVAMKKGALCRLDATPLSLTKCAVLDWLLPPRLLTFPPDKRK
jgi:phosphohistidine phosphatase